MDRRKGVYPGIKALVLTAVISLSLTPQGFSGSRLNFTGDSQEVAVIDTSREHLKSVDKIWATWSSWMQSHYPRWWDKSQSLLIRPWFYIREINGQPFIFIHKNDKDGLPLTYRNLFKAFLKAHPVQTNPWLLNASTEALMLQFSSEQSELPPRPLEIPFGQTPEMAVYDALILNWIEQATPEEWLAGIWLNSTPLGVHDLSPILTNSPRLREHFEEWLTGFFIHWAMQDPDAPVEISGQREVKPFAATRIHIRSSTEYRSATLVRLYFDRNIHTTLWIIARSPYQTPKLYRLPVNGNTAEVVLGDRVRTGETSYDLVFIHPKLNPYETPIQIRWTTEPRRDLPYVITRMGIVPSPDGYQIEWETALEFQTHKWWIERWDPLTTKWIPIHRVGIPAVQESYFPISYIFVDKVRKMTFPRYRLRVELLSGQILTVTELNLLSPHE